MEACYIYYYKLDSNREPIGRVMATSLDDARIQISFIKRLPVNDIEQLFNIEIVGDRHGNNV